MSERQGRLIQCLDCNHVYEENRIYLGGRTCPACDCLCQRQKRQPQPECRGCRHPLSFHSMGRKRCQALGCLCKAWDSPPRPELSRTGAERSAVEFFARHATDTRAQVVSAPSLGALSGRYATAPTRARFLLLLFKV